MAFLAAPFLMAPNERQLFGRSTASRKKFGDISARNPLRADAAALMHASYGHPGSVEEMSRRGYELDQSLSDADTRVFVKNGVPTVLHRGSATTTDWAVSDSAIAAGLAEFDPRLAKARRITAAAEAKYGRRANAAGHSLGGRLAEESGAGGWTLAYNKASGPADLFKASSTSPFHADIRNSTDIVSGLSAIGRGSTRPGLVSSKLGKDPVRAHLVGNLD